MYATKEKFQIAYLLVACLIILLSASSVAAAQNDPAPRLFTPHVTGADAQIPSNGIINSRVVDINFDLLTAVADIPPGDDTRAVKTLQLDLFGNESYTAVFDHWESTSPTSYTWSGHIKNVNLSQVAFSVFDGVMAGTIQIPGALFQIRYVGNGLHSLNEIDLTAMPTDKNPIPVRGFPDESDNQALAGQGDDGSTIDVLVVWTAAARSAVGGTAAMNALINLAIIESNRGFSNSGVTQRLRLAHAEEVTYAETGFDWDTTLDRLTGTGDGYMDTVHTLRDAYNADEVVLLVNDTAYCGLAWLMTTPSNSFKTHAFAVVSQICATGYYSFAHELGHNQGAQHDRDNSGGGPGAFSYSYGYQAPDNSFRTVMAYNCSNGGCPRVNYWSNPEVSYNAYPTGVIYTSTNSADNRRTLNNTYTYSANWRTSGSCSLAAPTLISPSGAISTTTPTYSWNSAGAEQYQLWVSDAATSGKIQTWYTSSQVGCAAGGTCSITPTTALVTGAATFWVRGWKSCNGGTYSAWSAATNFTVATGGPPGPATLISPSGTITTTTPTYAWNAVPAVTWYYLWVADSSASPKIAQWITAATAGCGSGIGTCSYTPSTALASGNATWYIQTYNSSGYGPWSSGKAFSISPIGPPGPATLISPSGTITTATPTYVWNAVAAVTWYYLWVNDSAGSQKIAQWYTAAQAGCASGTGACSVTPATSLAAGAGQWFIQTYNANGYGPWSSPLSFNVSVGPPGKTTLVSPTGTISTKLPAYTWNAVSSSTWYYLWVNDATSNGRIQQWYTSAQANCESGTGICSVTPAAQLAAGACRWWVLTWSSNGTGPWSDPLAFTVQPGSSELEFSFDPASVPQNNTTPCLGVLPAWFFDTAVAETGGSGFTVSTLVSSYYDGAGNFLNSQTNTGADFANWFDACGTGSTRVPPNGRACASFCVHLGGRASGSVSFSITGTDDTGKEATFTSSKLSLLGSTSLSEELGIQGIYTNPQIGPCRTKP